MRRHGTVQVCILSQKDDLVVEALSVDSLGSGIKVTTFGLNPAWRICPGSRINKTQSAEFKLLSGVQCSLKAAARESDDARSLASSEPPGCLAASSDNQSAGGSALPSAAGNPLLAKLDVSTRGNGRNGSGSSPMGDALPHTSPLHAVSPTAGSRETSGGDGNNSGAKGA
jgi:hypothetical protein